MTAGYLGSPTGNVIVPVTNFTKRTKQLALALTTDLTVSFTGASPTNVAITRATAIFYADSANVWRMRFNIEVSCDSTASINTCVITFAKASLRSKSTCIQAITAAWGTYGGLDRAYTGSTSTLVAEAPGATITGCRFSGDIELNAEPTDYTTAANLENNVNVAAYIPPASGATPGLVDGEARIWNGVKTFAANPKVTAIDYSPNTATSGTGITSTSRLLNWYEVGTWTPVLTDSDSSFGTITYTEQVGYWTRIGNVVFLKCAVGWNNTSGTPSGSVLRMTGLPFTAASTRGNIFHIAGDLLTGGTTGFVAYGEVIPATTRIDFFQQKIGNNIAYIPGVGNGGATARSIMFFAQYTV